MKKLVLVLTLLVLVSPAMAEKHVDLVTLNWEPYVGENLLNQGFTTEIIVSAFKRVGYETNIRFLPWKRGLQETMDGKYDAIYAAYYSDERSKIYKYSDPFAEGPILFCAKKDFKLDTYKRLKDLSPYAIGIVAGYVNTPEFDTADYLKKDEAKDDLQNLKKLAAGRVDMITIDKYVALNYIKNNPTLDLSASDVKFLNPPLISQKLYLMFTRATDDYQQKVDDFNKGLKMITDDGTVKQILERHGFE